MKGLSDDLVDLLTTFVDEGVEFVVVGGYAVAHYGHVRATKDLDLLVRPTPDNADKTYRALAAFGAPIAHFDVQPEDFVGYDGVLQIGVPPNRADIITKVDGIGYADAVRAVEYAAVAGRQVPVIGRDALIANKRASGRPQDLADVHALTQG